MSEADQEPTDAAADGPSEQEICRRAGNAAERELVRRCSDPSVLIEQYGRQHGVSMDGYDPQAVLSEIPQGRDDRHRWVICRTFVDSDRGAALVDEHDNRVTDAMDAAWNELRAETMAADAAEGEGEDEDPPTDE